ncbi:MAG: DUF262 domain-containing protein [Pseudomonadota bacterium]
MPETLERRPEARTFKVEDLLAEVQRGRVRIPSFQRGLKWTREDAKKLIDSLYRGYPVGTLLFWETAAEGGDVRFGSLTFSAESRSDALWVVDGQQRIVSLARVLLAPEPDQDDFALYFDLDTGEFVTPPSIPKRSAAPARWLPMTEVLDSQRLIRWLLDQAPANRERQDRAIDLGKRIREYDIPAYVVRTDSEATLRDVFNRINSSGKRLEASEVFDALNGARSQTRPATIPEIASELETLGFGRVEDKILYRLLRVLQGEDVTEGAKDEPLKLSADEAERAYRQTAKTARDVIQFLKKDVGIPHYDLLPYKQPFVTLGKFFQHHPAPRPRSRDLLVRWVWRGALNGAHRGDTVSTRKALDRIVADSEEASVQRMLDMVKERPKAFPNVLDPFNFRFAASKLQALALMELGPRDLETGALLHLGELLSETPPDQDPPFVQIIGSIAGNDTAIIQSVANRLAHPGRSRLRQLLVSVQDPAILASHGITKAAIAALRAGDAKQFLTLRAGHLGPHFNRFFQGNARWDELDRPSLSSLVVPDGED